MECLHNKNMTSVSVLKALFLKITNISYDDILPHAGYAFFSKKDKETLDAIPESTIDDLEMLERIFMHSDGLRSLQEIADATKHFSTQIEALTYEDLAESVGYRRFSAEEKEKLACLACGDLETPVIVGPEEIQVWTLED